MRVEVAPGQMVAVEGAVAEAISRLVALAPALAEKPAWKARISVAGRAVKVIAEAPVAPLRPH